MKKLVLLVRLFLMPLALVSEIQPGKQGNFQLQRHFMKGCHAPILRQIATSTYLSHPFMRTV